MILLDLTLMFSDEGKKREAYVSVNMKSGEKSYGEKLLKIVFLQEKPPKVEKNRYVVCDKTVGNVDTDVNCDQFSGKVN